MTRLYRLLAGTILAGAMFGAAPAMANVWLCAPDAAGAQTGPRNVTNQAGTRSIQLNARGCGSFIAADVAQFLAQGFVATPSGGQVSVGPLTGTTAGGNGVTGSATPSVFLPPGAVITGIVAVNQGVVTLTGNGLKIGTTSGGTDVVALMSSSVGEPSFGLLVPQYDYVTTGQVKAVSSTYLIAKKVFSPTAQQQIFIDTPGAWGTASVTVTIFYNIL